MPKITVPIYDRWTRRVLFAAEIDEDIAEVWRMREAVRLAIAARANLSGADLSGADLSGANLSGADLSGANLSGADLTRANLTDADLTRADLTRANLSGADLTRADLTRANLSDADLTRANLTQIRRDVEHVLFCHAAEVPGLLAALRAGKVDGSTYTGACACLVGTLAHQAGANLDAKPDGWEMDSCRAAERFFMGIRQGNTPENHGAAKIVEGWILDWQRRYAPEQVA